MPDKAPYVPCAEVSISQGTDGYWSARLVADLSPEWAEWRSAAGGFHDAGEAMEWARGQINLAVVCVGSG